MEGFFEHGNEPFGSINAGKLLSGCRIGGFSRRAQLHGLVRIILCRTNTVILWAVIFCSKIGKGNFI
jgi:hypothetical protein